MSNLVENRIYSPAKFWAGEFPVVTESGQAAAAISQYDLIMSDGSGGLVKATNEGIANLVGIAMAAAEAEEPVVYAMTGEVFADAVGLNDIALADAKAACRKLSIFLK